MNLYSTIICDLFIVAKYTCKSNFLAGVTSSEKHQQCRRTTYLAFDGSGFSSNNSGSTTLMMPNTSAHSQLSLCSHSKGITEEGQRNSTNHCWHRISSIGLEDRGNVCHSGATEAATSSSTRCRCWIRIYGTR